METLERQLPPNPREKANFLSILFHSWTIPLFKKGFKKILQLEDIFQPLENDKSGLLGDRIEKNWTEELNKPKGSSLVRVVAKTFKIELLILAAGIFFNDVVIRVAQPFLLGKLLLYFRDVNNKITYQEAITYASEIVLLNALGTLLSAQIYVWCQQNGMRIRVAISSLIYRKALRLSQTAFQKTSNGKIVNLLSNDVNCLDWLLFYGNSLWSAPLLTIVCGFLMYDEIGWTAIIGIGVMLVIVPIQSYLGKLSSKFRFQTSERTDERVRFMDEIIYGIQAIKMYAWNLPFSKIISEARRKELKVILKNSYVRGLFMTFMLFTTRITLFSTMLSMALLYNNSDQITAARVFSVASYFNVIGLVLSQRFVRAFAFASETLVAFKRFKKFLSLEEKSKRMLMNFDNGLSQNEDVIVSLKDVSAEWETFSNQKTEMSEPENEILTSLNADFPKGKLIGIIGPVGSGKTSLLQLILGELPLKSGSLDINGSISYASQEPWIFPSTVRQNILFGEEFNHSRYNATINSCALTKDFEQLERGDETTIGDRGASLSGGQKARVNLARTVYRNADIYLFDDPLSAVDAHVGKHIFDECIGPNSRLAQIKATRILVTHQVHFLNDADWLIYLRDGKIEMQGAPTDLADDLAKNGFELALKIDEAKNDENSRKSNSLGDEIESNSEIIAQENKHSNDESCEKLKKNEMNGMEASSKGTVQGSVLLKYFLSGAHWMTLTILILSFVASQFFASAADYWASVWTKQEEMGAQHKHNAKNETQFTSRNFYVSVNCAILAALFIVSLARGLGFYWICVQASQKIHDSMFKGLISTSMYFFNKNSSGRILNRFVKDLGSMDEALPKAMLDASQMILNILASIIMTSIVNLIFIFPIAVLSIAFIFARKIYVKTSNNVKRLESMAKSPVFTHLASTLSGLPTVRALAAENILKKEFDNHQDIHTACFYVFVATEGAFAFVMDTLCFVFITCVVYACIFIDFHLSGSLVGLAITQAMSLTGSLSFGVRQSAEVSNQMTAVERLLEYQQLESEKEPKTPKQLPKEWPQHGCIEFKNVSFRYSDGEDPVLRDLLFTVKPNEKIGIVGRTGAGKSSLIGAIFRLANVEGEIIIDDIETSTIALDDLRSRISIIPQDPILFSGTLRRNLDPFEQYADDEIWQALEDVELKEIASSIFGLSTNVSARGCNLSVGQRQLLCLARAILRKNKILILDEATANTDPQTDSLIQQTIRKKFANCTVLTVAHRLHTIIDSDRILVMKTGRIIEFDAPNELLKKECGAFADMANALGDTYSEQLQNTASFQHRLKMSDGT